MKALIFNSGIGKRMEELTKSNPKAMIKLLNGETILDRQIRLLENCGIRDFIITTGPFPEQINEVSSRHIRSNFIFVNNDKYSSSNCIYSFYLASELIDDDVVILHGDLVFSERTARLLINDPHSSCVSVDRSKKLPEKDFKGRIVNEKISEISVKIFDKNCVSLQPMYKISKKDITPWILEVNKFIQSGNVNVYAEEAFNSVSDAINLFPVWCDGYYIEEIDNKDDYTRVSLEIALCDCREQKVLRSIDDIKRYINDSGIRRMMIVCSHRTTNTELYNEITKITDAITFSQFESNPTYESAVDGMKAFINGNCDSIISIGGGSAIDIAKCILAFSTIEDNNYLSGKRKYKFKEHIAIPTTAGTGSESTRYATIYCDGIKYSVSGYDEVPSAIALLPELLNSVPQTVKISSLFDALCQSIESIWSINSTIESIKYSSRSIELILNNIKSYFENNEGSFESIQMAANLSGRAINITQTTAAHALSYILTSRKNIPHGIAVLMCMIPLWKDLLQKNETSIEDKLTLIDKLFSCNDHISSFNKFLNIVNKYSNITSVMLTDDECVMFAKTVNLQRLSNYPVQMNFTDIVDTYHNIKNNKTTNKQ